MTGIAADLSQPDGVQRVLYHIAAVRRFDILVANTGGPRPGPARGVTPHEWQANFEAMAISLFRVADAVLPSMIEAG